jgi:two-component system response regulator AtoC
MMERILIIDDDAALRETLKICLNDIGYEIILAENGYLGIDLFKSEHPDLVISDLKLPDIDGMKVLNEIVKIDNNLPVIMITAYEDVSITIKAIQQGAYDILEKPIEKERLKSIVIRALNSKKLSERLGDSIFDDGSEFSLENNLVVKSPAMKEIVKSIGKISSHRVNVLIEGESGTGKELIAKIIHYSGITKNEPFVAVNCTALSETLLESELFGHVKGAFTGAIRDKKGKFELARTGTIFLDEISEISQDLQAKLLRVIQEKEYERVGGESIIPMGARLIAATNRNLADYVQQGKFREDLFYRLKVFIIQIPPLRKRKEAIPHLVLYLLKKINNELHKNVNKIPYEVMEMLQNYEWTGNVRELENALLQAVVLSKSDVLEKENILLRKENLKPNKIFSDKKMSLAELEKFYIKMVLDEVKWNKKEACKILGVTKPTLYSKIKNYNLEQGK